MLAAAAVAIVLLVAPLARIAAFHLLPPGVTGEADRLAGVLSVSPGQTVAEIGAGAGVMTVEMARRVGTGGRVYATELAAGRREEIRVRVSREGFANVIVVEAGATETHLPEGCCAAIFMRNVYHHIERTGPFNASVRRAIRDGGRFGVVDFEPGAFWFLAGASSVESAARSGHGVARAALIAEVTPAGFTVERQIEDWGGRMFLVLFRATAPASSP